MDLERKHLCPLLKKKCIQLDCEWFIKVAGTDPQNKDREIEEWGCAINFQFIGLLEVAKRVSGGLDGVQKSTESFRNEVVSMNKAGLVGLVQAAGSQLLNRMENGHAIDDYSKR